MEPDAQLTMLHNESNVEDSIEPNDEVEELRNSLREIVQDQAVRPKLQCLMMDPSFSMVTIQSEDSGIMWETASSRCSTPWASEFSTYTSEACYDTVRCSAMPASGKAGNIIIIMDDDRIAHQKRKKGNSKSRGKKPKSPPMVEEPPEATDRPAMVEVSAPNLRSQNNEEGNDMRAPKEQSLFCLVSEGSEILNIVVPPKLAMVDEEESIKIKDNLAYLEKSPMLRAGDTIDEETQLFGHGNRSKDKDKMEAVKCAEQEQEQRHLASFVETIAKPSKQGASKDMDYFEKFTLMDEHTPVNLPTGDEEQGTELGEEQTLENKEQSEKAQLKSRELDGSADDSGGEITSEHLDDVFYGGGGQDEGNFEREEEPDAGERELPKFPLKESGSALFGSQETILTPIFLPPGPPKIIDPALLDEPKAMAFLYTDLYEEAVGSRKKEDDTESITSEKSFHSRVSDIEDASGYLEKFVLKDETPMVEVRPTLEDKKEEGFRMLSLDSFELTAFHVSPDKVLGDKVNLPEEEDITDFFRTSASSSPCEDEGQILAPEEKDAAVKCPHNVFKEDKRVLADMVSSKADQNIAHHLAEDKGKTKEKSETLPIDTDGKQTHFCITNKESQVKASREETVIEKLTNKCVPPQNSDNSPHKKYTNISSSK